MEITHTLPKYQTRNLQWHPKFNSYNCNMSFIKMQRTQSLTRPTTHAAISTFSTSHNAILSQYSQPFTCLATQKQTQYSMLQIKPYSKNTFQLSPSYFFTILLLFLTNLARALQHSVRKQHSVNTHMLQPILTNKQTSPSLPTTKPST